MAMTTILVSLHLRAPFLCYGASFCFQPMVCQIWPCNVTYFAVPLLSTQLQVISKPLEMRCLQACQDLSVGLNPIMSPHMAKSEMHRHADSNGGWGNYYGNNYGYSGGYDSGYGGGEPL